MKRFFALLLPLLAATTALAAPEPSGSLNEYKVEMPLELRKMAGRGQVSPVKHALVTIAAPAKLDMARNWPVMVVSATSDPQFHSSRQLLDAYADVALAAGWILVAADPAEEVTVAQDDVPLRLALVKTALATLALQWKGAANAPLAFGGFSGGAKYSGWLAASFASEGRDIAGVYLAGINQDTLVPAARQFNVLDAKFRNVPVFLQSGLKDEISTPENHRGVSDALQKAGFKRIRIEYFPGGHDLGPKQLRTALDWFRALHTFAGTPPAR